ncbi:ExbD/TolR family protein [candidate division KSB1 bacterium]
MKIQSNLKYLDTFSFSSLTDIVLLLLIFFLLSSSFIVQPGIKVHLPKSETADVHQEKSISITITKDNAIYLNDQQVTIGEITGKLQQMLVLDEDQVILLKSDKDVTIEKIVEVWDLAKIAGADKFHIVTERR